MNDKNKFSKLGSSIANIMSAPQMPYLPTEQRGKLIVMAMMVYAGEIEASERIMAPFRALATPITDMVRPMRYQEIFPPEEVDYHPTAVGHTLFIDRTNHDTVETIIEYLQTSDALMRVEKLRVLGGALAPVPVEATAFEHRQSRIMVNLAAFYTDPEDKAFRQVWMTDFAAALYQGNAGLYTNFLDDEGKARVRAAYPILTWDLLRMIKARYDPANLFRLNQNIPPAV